MRSASLIALIAIAVSFSPPCYARPVTEQPAYDAAAARLEEAIRQAMDDYGIPGAIAGVWVPGCRTWITAQGTADLATGRAIATSDKVRIASITKTFVATVVLQLVDEGRISLNDTLDMYSGGFGVPGAGGITVRQLCNMTSGIFGFTEDETFLDIVTNDPLRVMTPQELVNIAIAHDPYFAPGEGWHYSDTNYVLLQMIVEQVTGNEVGEEIRKRIIEPLGLENTSYPAGPSMPEGSCHGYMDDPATGGKKDVTELDPSIPGAAGAMISNLADLKTWAGALADGRLLSEESHREQMSWVAVEGQPLFEYGLGIMRLAGYVGHNGTAPGYNSVMYYLPSRGITVIILFNWLADFETSIADRVFEEFEDILLSYGTLQLSAGCDVTAAGDSVSVDIAAGHISFPFDAYTAVVGPDGSVLSMDLDGKLHHGLTPLARGVPSFEGPAFRTIFRSVLPPGVQKGPWHLIFGLVDPGAEPTLNNARAVTDEWVTVR